MLANGYRAPSIGHLVSGTAASHTLFKNGTALITKPRARYARRDHARTSGPGDLRYCDLIASADQ